MVICPSYQVFCCFDSLCIDSIVLCTFLQALGATGTVVSEAVDCDVSVEVSGHC